MASETDSGQSKPKLPRGVRLKHDEVRDQWILLAPERIVKLDMIALEILRRCDGQTSIAAMVDELARNFSADREQVSGDVHELLQGLAAKGMLQL